MGVGLWAMSGSERAAPARPSLPMPDTKSLLEVRSFASPLCIQSTNIIVQILCVACWGCSKSPAHGELRGYKTTSIC